MATYNGIMLTMTRLTEQPVILNILQNMIQWPTNIGAREQKKLDTIQPTSEARLMQWSHTVIVGLIDRVTGVQQLLKQRNITCLCC